MSKYTPGPWEISALPNDTEFTHKISAGKELMWLCAIGNNATSNARLIAAAPELLEEAQMLLRACEADAHNVILAMEKGRRAIAKATGSKA